MTEVLKRTVGTQTPLSVMMTVAAATDLVEDDKVNNVAHPTPSVSTTTYFCETTPQQPEGGASTETNEAGETEAKATSEDVHKEEEATTSNSDRPIFSPKSAAVALSSLYNHNPAQPRQCFPSTEQAPPPAEGMAGCAANDGTNANLSDYTTQQQQQQQLHYYAPSSYQGTTPSGQPYAHAQPLQGYAWPPAAAASFYPPSYGQQDGSIGAGVDPTTNARARLASANTSLVTPTPKKIKMLAEIAPRQTPHTAVAVPHGHLSAAMQRPPLPLQQVYHAHPGMVQQMHHHQHHRHAPLPPPQHQQHPPPLPPSSSATYNRKNKSLGVLADNFMKTFQHCARGTEIGVDEVSVELGVERRRIYDVVNILESITILVKKGKNTYTWLGKESLLDMFGELQARAIKEGYAEDAAQHGLDISFDDNDAKATDACLSAAVAVGRRGSLGSTTSDDSKKDSSKSLAKLSQQFLQVFLVGHDSMSLPQASEKIQGALTPEAYAAIGMANTEGGKEELSDPSGFRRAAQRGLKTKIRRMYDIANVFLSLDLLKKVEHGKRTDSVEQLAGSVSRRPYFGWAYTMSPKQIQDHYLGRLEKASEEMAPPSSITAQTMNGGDDTTPSEDRTPLRTLEESSSTMAPPSTGMTASSWPSSREATPITTGAMGPPSSSEGSGLKSTSSQPVWAHINAKASRAETKDAHRNLLANIHQTGGAWDGPATPSTLLRTVSLPQNKAQQPS